MKIRIKGNTLRLRLTQSEVAQFEQEGIVEEMIQFPTQNLYYRLALAGNGTDILAEFFGQTITVQIPVEKGKAWATTDEVTLKANQTLPDGKELALLIEKDFACLVPRVGEEESDHYPNPLAQ